MKNNAGYIAAWIVAFCFFGWMIWADPEAALIIGKATLHFFAQIIPLLFLALVIMAAVIAFFWEKESGE